MTTAGIQFGWSVAVQEVAADDITAVVGAPTHHETGSTQRGRVFIFHYDGSDWDEVAVLTDGDDNRDLLGKSLSLTDDRLIVGAAFQPVDGETRAGAVYEFMRQGGVWGTTPATTFVACDTGEEQRFGWSVSLAGDLLAVGQFARVVNPAAQRSCHSYRLMGESWVHVAELDPEDFEDDSVSFGWDVATDGERAVISDNDWNDTAEQASYGRIYSFQDLPSDGCSCPEDVDVSGLIGFGDLLVILSEWGDCPDPPDPCAADVNDDDVVDMDDVEAVLAAWGNCPNVFSTSIPTLGNELEESTCLEEEDWDLFYETMTDPEVSQAVKDNMQCWMNHYLNECSPSCGQSPCTGADPFGNPCGGH